MPIGAKSFREALRVGAEVFQSLKKILKSKNLSTSVGDEGGFAPRLSSNEEALRLILQAIEQAGYKPGKEVFLALDVAASTLGDAAGYSLKAERLSKISAEKLTGLYENWISRYPIVSIEDGLGEEDWNGWGG